MAETAYASSKVKIGGLMIAHACISLKEHIKKLDMQQSDIVDISSLVCHASTQGEELPKQAYACRAPMNICTAMISPSLLPYHSASPPDSTPNPSSTRKSLRPPPFAPSPPPTSQPHTHSQPPPPSHNHTRTLTVPDHVRGDVKASPEAVAERGKYGWNWNPFTVSGAA